MNMKKILALTLFLAPVVCTAPALAQGTQTFSTYVTGLAPVGSVIGSERMFALQVGIPKTLTPYQILNAMSGDCSVATPPTVICLKTNGVAFAPSATTDTTNASNIGSGTLPLARLALANGSIYVGNASNVPAAAVVSGDCTVTNTGVFTCLKVNGVALVASATTDTTNASNISTGTLANARMAAVNLAAGNVNGGVNGALPFTNHPTGSLDTILGYWGSTTQSATSIPNCGNALTYSTTTHAWACNVGSGGNVVNSGTPTVGQIGVWVDATHLQGVSISALATINTIKVSRFLTPGTFTYTPTTGLQFAVIECLGSGGGGGNDSNGATSTASIGSGGSSGGYSRDIEPAANLLPNQTVVVGAGGGSQAVGNASSLGVFCQANGGPAGNGASGGTIANAPAAAGAGTGNLIAVSGNPGFPGLLITSPTNVYMGAGQGASSHFGGGASAANVGNGGFGNGLNATGFGSGGSGAWGYYGVTATSSGGAGSGGAVIVTEYANQ